MSRNVQHTKYCSINQYCRVRRYPLESIHTVYKLISWIVRRNPKRDLAPRTALNPHEDTIDQLPCSRIIQILTAAFYGSPPVFLVSPIFIANRRSIRPQSCRPRRRAAAAAMVAAPLPRMCSFTFVREVARFSRERSCMSVWFYDNVGRLPNRRANMTCTILYSRTPRAAPFPDFPLPRPHILFARWSSRICMYAFRTLSEGKCIASTPRNMAGFARTKARSKFASISIYGQFIARRVTVNVLIVNNSFTSAFSRDVERDTQIQTTLSYFYLYDIQINDKIARSYDA